MDIHVRRLAWHPKIVVRQQSSGSGMPFGERLGQECPRYRSRIVPEAAVDAALLADSSMGSAIPGATIVLRG